VACAGVNNSILGGGYQISGVGSPDVQKLTVVQNYPSNQTHWTVQAVEAQPVGSSWTLTAYAVCGVA